MPFLTTFRLWPGDEFTVSQPISRVVHKAMAKQAWHRFASARDFGDTLNKALRESPSSFSILNALVRDYSARPRRSQKATSICWRDSWRN